MSNKLYLHLTTFTRFWLKLQMMLQKSIVGAGFIKVNNPEELYIIPYVK